MVVIVLAVLAVLVVLIVLMELVEEVLVGAVAETETATWVLLYSVSLDEPPQNSEELPEQIKPQSVALAAVAVVRELPQKHSRVYSRPMY